ncbi:Intraflagellar transport protein 46 homolog [Durusdinium trenchii]|uniref:Intraflagellar transport protein 46 homolog n=1 Tax=Durusdinium trenchii TaxID=1381693 RepID=A0ABP0JW12_9DINO
MSGEGKAALDSEEEDDFSDFSGEEEQGGSRRQRQGLDSSEEEEDDDDDSDFDASFAESVGKGQLEAGDDDEEDDDEERDDLAARQKGGAAIQVREVDNQPYDARIDLEGSFSDESVDTAETGTPKMRQAVPSGDRGDSPPNTLASPKTGFSDDAEEIPGVEGKRQEGRQDDDASDGDSTPAKKKNLHGVKLEAADASMQEAAQRAAARRAQMEQQGDDREDEDDDEDDDESESSASQSTPKQRGGGGFEGFDIRDFDHLNVSGEVKELFQYIERYKPHDVELDTKLRCFIPDFIPAVGDIDAFIKIPRADMQPDELGLRVLDEPSANQSDATVLDLQLRAISKKSVKNPMVVRSIENASKDKKAVQGWIDSIKDLHRSKPPPQVHYTKQMPDIESLMQVWPEEVEQLMKEIKLPGADIDLDLKDYARVVCAVLDIPVFSSMVEPLHVLFTLYSEFRNNQHFRNVDNNNKSQLQEPHQEQENFFSNEFKE